jgi:hypothetical protein
MHFSVGDYRDVISLFEELHHLGAFLRQLGPAGFCIGILFKAPQCASDEFEINLFQMSTRSGPHAVGFIFHGDDFQIFDERLAPNGEKDFVESGHCWMIRHSTLPSRSRNGHPSKAAYFGMDKEAI